MREQVEVNDELRLASGSVNDPRPLVGFLYELMRDHLPTGDVAELVRQNEEIDGDNEALFTNGFLARYSQNLADRLRVYVGVTGEERTVRFEALDRVFRAASQFLNVPLDNPDFPSTEFLVALADGLERKLKEAEAPKPRVYTKAVGVPRLGYTGYVAYFDDGTPASSDDTPKGEVRENPKEAIGSLVQEHPELFGVTV